MEIALVHLRKRRDRLGCPAGFYRLYKDEAASEDTTIRDARILMNAAFPGDMLMQTQAALNLEAVTTRLWEIAASFNKGE